MSIGRWIRGWKSRRKQSAGCGKASPKRLWLCLEQLEDRLVPDSGGATGVLTSAGNLQLNPSNQNTGGFPQVIPNVKIQLIFLSDPGHGGVIPGTSQTAIKNYFTALTANGYIPNLMAQYGNTKGLPAIGNGSLGMVDVAAAVTATGSVSGHPAYTDSDLTTIIQNEITAHNVAASDGLNNLYFIFTPPGDAVDGGGGETSVNAFLGYHSAFTDTTGKADYYAVIPDESSVNLNEFDPPSATNAVRGETVVSSHEFSEAITDCIPVQGWVNPVLLGSGENGDQAANEYYVHDGHEVQYEWSNAIIGPAHAPSTGAADLFINQVTPPAAPVSTSTSMPVASFTTANTALTAGNFSAQVFNSDSTGHGAVFWTVTSITGSNGHFVVNARPNSAVSPGTYGKTFSKQQGLYVIVNDNSAADATAVDGGIPTSLRYAPYVVASAAQLSYTTDAGTHNLVLNENAGNLELRDNGNLVFAQPVAQTSNIAINGLNDPASVNNSLTLDYSGGVFTNNVSFDGGNGGGAHKLTVQGGTFTNENFNYTSANAGTVQLDGQTITYSRLTPLTSTVTATNITFNLPASAQAQLVDDGTNNNGISEIASLNGGFETTTFSNPSGVLTVNPSGGNSLVQLAAMDNAFAPVQEVFNGQASDTFQLMGAGAVAGATSVTLAVGKLDLNGLSPTIDGLSGAGTITSGVSGAVTLGIGMNGGGGTFSGVIQDGSGTVNLRKFGAGSETLSAGNTYSGTTTVSGGTLADGVANALPIGTDLLVDDGATFDLNAHNQKVAAIVANGSNHTGAITNSLAGGGNLATLSVVNVANDAFAGKLTGNLALTENGVATADALILTGSANTYTGATTVTAGTLQVDGSITSNVTVNGGVLDGSGTTGTVTANGGAVVPGDGGNPGILNTGALTVAVGAAFNAVIGGNTAGSGGGHFGQDSVASGIVTLGGTLNLSAFSGFTPAGTDVYVIINNGGGSGIFGVFLAGAGIDNIAAGLPLPEGAILSNNFLGSNLQAVITYVGGANSRSVAIKMLGIPVFTDGPPPATATATVFYSFTYTASGSPAPTFSLSSGTLPAGLNLTPAGVLSGTPTAAGIFNGVVTATNSAGTDTQNFSITVGLLVTVSPGSLPAGQVGANYSQTIGAIGGVGPYTFTVSAGSLPAGVSLTTAGALSGTPTADGNFMFTIKATDSSGSPGPFSGTQAYTLTVATPTIVIAPATLRNPQDGASFNQSVAATGGTAPYTYSISAGALPTGLSLDASSGAITGTSTAGGPFTFTVQAIDSSGGSGPFLVTKQFTVTVSAPTFVFSPQSLSNAQVGASHSQTVTVTGGIAPYGTFTISAGVLPAGLTLDPNSGAISGTPTAGGNFNFTVSATDSSTGTGPFTQGKAYTLTVAAPTFVFSPQNLNNAKVGASFSQSVTVAGGTAPYGSFTVSVGVLPAGLTLNASSGTISGTPTAGGTFNFTVSATDSSTGTGPFTQGKAYSLTVAAPTFVFSPQILNNAQVGASFSQNVTVVGGTAPYGTFTISAGALPAGLTLNASSGAISGTPTAGGNFNFTVSATDASTGSGPFTQGKAYSLTVAAPTFVFSPQNLNNAQVGASFSQNVTVGGGTAPYGTFTISAGALPAGLTLNASTGAITGTPTAGGNFSFTVSATDSSAGTGPFTQGKAYTLSVAAPTFVFSPTSLANAQVGASYTDGVTITGGTAPYAQFTISAGALPAGLTINAGTGVISGTPTAGGSFNFTVSATDSSTGTGPFTQGKAYSLTVAAPTFVFAPANAANAQVGASFSQTITVTGGTAPYGSFTISAGALPAGLTFNAATHVISGTPTAGGTFNFTVSATDSSTGTGPFTQGKAYTLSVAAPTFVFAPSSLGSAQVGVAYSQSESITGGTAPYKSFTISAGALPAGLSINPATGALSGTPTAGGTFNFTVSATDSSTGTGPFTQGKAYTLTVAAPTIVLSRNTYPTGEVGIAFSQPLTASGGTAPYHYAISAGVLPDGLSINANTGTITGTPTKNNPFTFTVSATDSSSGTGPYTLSQPFTITINAHLAITTATLATFWTVNAAGYNQPVATSGGVAPTTFAVSPGTLAAGLTLDVNTGVITGKPTAVGTSTFTVAATDSLGATANQGYTVIVIPSEFAYDQVTHQLTITPTTDFPNFQYTQATTLVAGNTSTVYTFTLNDNASPQNSVSQPFPDTALSVSTHAATVSVKGIGGNALLITNDTYPGPGGALLETAESVSLGSLADAGVGTLSKSATIAGNSTAYTFLALSGFPVSYAYVGRNDGTVQLFGTAGVPYNGFVSAGNYSYLGGPGLFHLAQGAASVYGYSAGQPTDFAYHYSANPGSAFVVSGVAFSYMSTMDTVQGVTQSYFNVGSGFTQNTGVSKNPGQDFAYIIDSPGNDTFVGETARSYMFSTGPSGNFTEFDVAYAFALVFGQSFVGGVDTATNSDPGHNVLAGFKLS